MPTRAEYVKYLRSLEGGYGPAKGLANNDNFLNAWYYGRRVSGDAYAWCVVTECYAQNHFGILAANGGKSAYVPDMKARAAKVGAKVVVRPKTTKGMLPGDALAYDFNRTNSPEHTGTFVKAISSTQFDAVEGNTSTAKYSDALALKRRNVSDVLWHIELLGVGTTKPNPPEDDVYTDDGELFPERPKTSKSFPYGQVRGVGLARDEPTVAKVRVAFHHKAGHGEIYELKVGGPKSKDDGWPAKTVQGFKTPADGDWLSIAWTNPEVGGSVGWDVS